MRVTSIRRHPDFGVVVIDQDPRGIGKQRHESCIWLWGGLGEFITVQVRWE